uniref:regulator of G-protein signaling 4-like n=1 Tax=Styela clava TaxID=7725 RepID=UPI0019395F81|nr:regulator of G-protein signaling 4-like [Styela clava]
METTNSKSGYANHPTLIEILNDKKLKVGFRMFLKSEFSAEHLDFCAKVEKYKNIKNTETRNQRMFQICDEYILPGSINQINLDHFTRQQIIQHMATNDIPNIDIFNKAQKYVFNNMENDAYQRFICSKYYDICCRSSRRTPCQFLHDIFHQRKLKQSFPRRPVKGIV